MRPLCEAYDLAVLDLDGVVYIGASAVPGAVAALTQARSRGMHWAFVTNNAARPPESVAAHLVELGLAVEAADVVTSAQAAATLVSREVPAGSRVFVIGGPGLEAALRERGLVPVTDLAQGPVAVVQGYGPDMPWRQVIAGSLAVRRGLPWIASNTDLTVPTEFGPGPGNGALVDLVGRYADRQPVVAGKPEPALFRETLERVGGRRPLVVGDRLDTDIDGAVRMGWDSLLVMTGVSTIEDLLGLEAGRRPTYVGADLSCLMVAPVTPVPAGDGFEAAGWSGRVRDGRIRISGAGDPHAWWQLVATLAWAHLDATGAPVDVTDLPVP